MSGAENPCILLLSFFVFLCPKKQKNNEAARPATSLSEKECY